MDRFDGIGGENHHVGSFSGFDCAGFLVDAHYAGWNNCGCLNCFHRRESGLNVKLDFAMQAVSGDGLVSPGDDGDACAMKRSDDLYMLFEDLLDDFGSGEGGLLMESCSASSGATFATPGSKPAKGFAKWR